MDDRYWVKLPARHAGAFGGIQIPGDTSRAGPPNANGPMERVGRHTGESLHPFLKHPDDHPLPLCIYCY